MDQMEKDEEKEKIEEIKKENEKAKNIINKLNRKLDDYEDINLQNKEAHDKLSKLYDLGVIDSDGKFILEDKIKEGEDMD
jgi:flagellin-specific chaperone FliS